MLTLINLGKIKKILAGLFFFFLPTQLGYFFWPAWSYFWGIKIDFLSPAVFLTDLILLVLLLIWILERFRQHHPPPSRLNKLWFWLIGGTTVLVSINLLFSFSPALSGYRALKWLQLIFLIGYFSTNFLPDLLIPLFFSLILTALLAWGQFLLQGSIQGVFWWAGERFFNSSTLGVAKMDLFGRLFVRPMATFSHPNSLAGFILVALIIFWFFRRFLVKKLGGFFYFGLMVMFSVLVITFSGAVWLTVLLLALIYLIKRLNGRPIGLVLAGLLLAFFSFLVYRLGLIETLSIRERLLLAKNAGQLFISRPILGWGLGNFISAQGQLAFSRSNFNFYQPVHNLVLLILAEAGLVGLAWLCYWLVKWWFRVGEYWRQLFLVIIFLGFFDHYWLTLQQNFLLLGVTMAIALFVSNPKRSKQKLG